MINQLLPIGSVITLDGAEKKLMIVGITVQNEEDGKIYDYIGVPYPEGYIDSEIMFLFFHKDIKEVDFIGFVNAESQTFRLEHAKILKDNNIISETDE